MAKASATVAQENATRSIPGVDQLVSLGRAITTLSHTLPGPMVSSWDLWIEMALQARRGSVVMEQHFFSHLRVTEEMGTQV
jgi:hypothetical protein